MPTHVANRLQTTDCSKRAVVSSQKAVSKFAPGFSLVEVLISMFIIVILGFLLLTASGTLAQTYSSNLQTIASKAASKEIETLRETPFASLPSSGAIVDPNLSKLPAGAATRTVTTYQSDPTIKQINVTVTWTFNGSARQLQMATLIYQNGI